MKPQTMKTPPPAIAWVLEEGFFGYVGTSGKDGKPHITPVIFVYDGSSIFFITSKSAKKLNNIRENDKIAFLVDIRDPLNLSNNKAVLVQGTARIISFLRAITQVPRLLRVRSLFLKKYPKYAKAYREGRERLPKAWQTTLFLRRVLVMVNIEKITYWRGARRTVSICEEK